MLVKVVPQEGDALEPVVMCIEGRKLVYLYRPETGQLYRTIIKLKEVYPAASIKIHHINEESTIIGQIGIRE